MHFNPIELVRFGLCMALLICNSAVRAQPSTQPSALQRFEYVEPKMGTVFHLLIWAPDQKSADDGAQAAWNRVDQLTKTLSDYDPDSELNKLCRLTDSGPMANAIPVSDDLWVMLVRSVEAARLSSGTFDITVGPLTLLQRESRKTGTLPDPQKLKEAMNSVRWQYIRLDPEHHTVQLLHAKMQLDVGGIAKGFASDEILKLLRERGLSHCLSGAAGDICAGDPPPGKEDWRIGIQSLKTPGQTSDYIHLHNYGISTSGDTYRSAVVNGKRYSHIIDPRTGIGLTTRIGVSAIAPEDLVADWIAAAVSILGPEEGMRMVDSMDGAAARAIVLDDQGNEKVYESKRLKQFLVPHPTTSEPSTQPLK
jgi:thiamine biosynthesis lipoprotein